MSTRNLGTAGLLSILLLPAAPAAAAEEERDLRGSVEVLYRDVRTDGSENKYDEDFDALDSGLRLGSLDIDWTLPNSRYLDYLRLDASGLGGDPYERTSVRMGRKDSFDFTFRNTKQDYIYDLFELVNNEDGAVWDSERRRTDLNLRIYPAERAQVFFRFQQGERSGSSLFMKDIQRDVFRLETPLDTRTNTYTVGTNLRFGPVDVLFSQSLRRYDHNFDNSTETDSGTTLSDSTILDFYQWVQNDSGGTELTTVKVHTPLGERVDLAVGFSGTLLGDEELHSRVTQQQLGIDSSGLEYGGTCAIGGTVCSSDATCDAINPGDVCVPDLGFSEAELDGDRTMVDADLSVKILRQLGLLLQYRSLNRDLDGVSSRDLDGDGVLEDEDGDGVPGSRVRNDYEINTFSAIFDVRPTRKIGVRAGYRLIDRELARDGFGDLRDTDYDSGDDETLIFGLSLRPVRWFRFNADYEDGDVDQPFNAVAPQENKHARLRAVFTPQDDMRIDLGFLDFEKKNTAPDLRDPTTPWDADSDGTSWSAAFFHRANEFVDYTLRYAEQDVKSDVAIVFDQAGFGATETGNSIFDNDNRQILARVGFRWAEPWDAFVRYWLTESDGDNLVLGDASGLVNSERIDQEFTDIELGLTYTFPSGIFVGGSVRDFDYDDANDLLDYDGSILTLRLGTRF